MNVIESRKTRPESTQTRARIRQLLGLPDADGFTVIQWNPTAVRPAEASYVVLRQRDDELGCLFAGAAYEHGRFWYLDPALAAPIEEDEILGWSYPPFDERLGDLGALPRG